MTKQIKDINKKSFDLYKKIIKEKYSISYNSLKLLIFFTSHMLITDSERIYRK